MPKISKKAFFYPKFAFCFQQMHDTNYTKSRIALIQHMQLHKEHNTHTHCTESDILLLQDTKFRRNKQHPLHSMLQFHRKNQKPRNTKFIPSIYDSQRDEYRSGSLYHRPPHHHRHPPSSRAPSSRTSHDRRARR
jgi:hypothetical protein